MRLCMSDLIVVTVSVMGKITDREPAILIKWKLLHQVPIIQTLIMLSFAGSTGIRANSIHHSKLVPL